MLGDEFLARSEFSFEKADSPKSRFARTANQQKSQIPQITT